MNFKENVLLYLNEARIKIDPNKLKNKNEIEKVAKKKSITSEAGASPPNLKDRYKKGECDKLTKTNQTHLGVGTARSTAPNKIKRKNEISPKNKKEGNKLAKRVTPNINFECVSEYTTQLTAVFCIQVPIREMDCPVK